MEVIFGKMVPSSSGNHLTPFLPGTEILLANFSRINQIRFRLDSVFTMQFLSAG